MYFDENDYDSDNDNEYIEFTADIIEEFNYDKKIKIVSFYKEKLSKEPEFIGIKNVCSGKILSFIEDTTKHVKLTKKDYKVNFEQYSIFHLTKKTLHPSIAIIFKINTQNINNQLKKSNFLNSI